MAPLMSGLTSCEVGQHSLYQPPVSMTSRLPSASSSTSVGWKSRFGEVRKSESLVANVAPVVLIRRSEDARGIAHQARGHRRAELREDGHQVAGLWMSIDDVVRFTVDAAVDRVDERVAAAGLRMLDEGGREEPLA